MIVFSDIAKLQELADTAPKKTNDEIIALSDKMKDGDEYSAWELFLTLLPVFCSEYKFQTGPSAKNSELLENCLRAYGNAINEFDFRSSGESFSHRLAWWIRQTRPDYVAANSKSIRIPIEDIKKLYEK